MKVLVLGGDGFCGWPTSLHLSNVGFDVCIIDNLVRRKIDVELEVESLTPIRSLGERRRVWKEVTGNEIGFYSLDISKQYKELLEVFALEKPNAVVHFAEQRSAPYSMKSSAHKRYTIDNNLNATNNVLAAIVESNLDIHVVHLGTMGVYGYNSSGVKIPEGYLKVKVETESQAVLEQEILFPPNPGSIYHLTKTQDALLFKFYAQNDKLSITDLHQGIVWGTETAETKLHDGLINRFDYDGDFGTVLNRFVMQAAVGHPLTVYGTGGQTRAFIHIGNTVQCIEIALRNRPLKSAPVEIFNQVTETHCVMELAKLISDITGTPIKCIENPRNEAIENELVVENGKFLQLGLDPITLKGELLREITDVAKKYAARCDTTKIEPKSFWNPNSGQ